MQQPATPITALTIARAAAELQRTTTQLIQALTAQLREPTEARDREVAELEARRDELHDRLTALEEAYVQQQRR